VPQNSHPFERVPEWYAGSAEGHKAPSLAIILSMAKRVDPEGVELRTLGELAPVDGLNVLELGCGDGRVTFLLADAAASVFAVDPDEERIARARAALPSGLDEKVTFAVAGAAEVKVPRRRFDLALFSWSL
jgi:ubiquinone/menaquinone biosynthesis C-methylase UbiE